MHNSMSNNESSKGEIVMYQPDETIRLEVRMGEDTVWLTQQQMAEIQTWHQIPPVGPVLSHIIFFALDEFYCLLVMRKASFA